MSVSSFPLCGHGPIICICVSYSTTIATPVLFSSTNAAREGGKVTDQISVIGVYGFFESR